MAGTRALIAMALGLVATIPSGCDDGAQAPRTLAPGADALGLYSVLHNYFALELTVDGEPLAFQHGAGNSAYSWMLPVAGDFDGDDLDTVGLYDTRTGVFLLAASNSHGAADTVVRMDPEMVPLAGDFDGDGVDTVGVYDPETGEFRLANHLAPDASGAPDTPDAPVVPDMVFRFGPIGVGVVGDFDGDGTDTVAVFVPESGEVHLSNRTEPAAPDAVFTIEASGAIPLAGDFDGDGVDSIAVYDFDTGEFHLRYQNSSGRPDATVVLSDRDWRWRPIAGQWHVPDQVGHPSAFAWETGDPAGHRIDVAGFESAYGEAARLSHLHSLLVVRHGVLVGEEYFHGFDAYTAGNVKSVSKSLLSALVGVASERGAITSIDDPVASYLPEYFADLDDPVKSTISIRHCMTMTAGLAWDDDDLAPFVLSDDWVGHVVAAPVVSPPGEQFLYSTGLTHLASALLTSATGEATREFARDHLFEPLGISAFRWDHDPQGYSFGGAEVYMTPRDMARFGYLYLEDGAIDGEQIVPVEWVRSSTETQVVVGDGLQYGWWWWRRTLGGHQVFYAWGYGGQFIFVVPALDLVVVATSRWNVTREETERAYHDIFELMNDHVLPSVAE